LIYNIFHKKACCTFDSATLGLSPIAIAMNIKKYVFSQMTSFLPKSYFERLVERAMTEQKVEASVSGTDY
jgi:hypothetical protein